MTPLLLIIMSTFIKLGVDKGWMKNSLLSEILIFIGHPFTALILATLLSILLCLKRKMSGQTILDLSTKALGPAGIIILVTGAGGVLKQILVDSGIGKMLAESLADSSIPSTGSGMASISPCKSNTGICDSRNDNGGRYYITAPFIV